MDNKTCYYTLKFTESDGIHPSGEIVYNRENTLQIGQRADCEVKLENTTAFEDIAYAEIVMNKDKNSWRIIKLSEHVTMRVNGEPVGYVHYLHDNDHISFDDLPGELMFNTRQDNKYSVHDGVVSVKPAINRNQLLIIATAIASLIVAGVIFVLLSLPENLLKRDFEAEISSVYKLRIDSVIYVHTDSLGNKTIINTHIPESNIIGTGFLTDDSLFITARHCIEFWLETDWNGENETTEIKRLAAEMETYNVAHSDDGSSRALVSKWSVLKDDNNNSVAFRLSSDSCFINRDRDILINIGTFDEDKYWRSFIPRFHRREMLLSDIAYFKCDHSGSIKRASVETMQSLESEDIIAVHGFPKNEDTHRTGNFVLGKLIKKPLCDSTYVNECLLHNAPIDKGFSGGPVFIKTSDGIFAIGVVSRTDAHSQNVSWAVPISEIDKFNDNRNH